MFFPSVGNGLYFSYIIMYTKSNGNRAVSGIKDISDNRLFNHVFAEPKGSPIHHETTVD